MKHYVACVLLCGCVNAPAAAPAPPGPPSPRLRPVMPAPAAPPPAIAPIAPSPEPAPPSARTADLALTMPGHRPAVVSIPGEPGAHPVLVVTHGAGGRAEPHCALWRRIAGPRGFILCPRGYPQNRLDPNTGWFYDGHPKLGEELSDALRQLRGRFGERADLAAPIFAGYSQGANMGSLLLPDHEAGFARAVLWEGGVGEHDEWNVVVAKRMVAHGGARVLFACGRPVCIQHAHTTLRFFARAGLEGRLVAVAGAGHTYRDPLASEVAHAFAWLVEGDGRWESDSTTDDDDDDDATGYGGTVPR